MIDPVEEENKQKQLELEKLWPKGILVCYYLDGWRYGHVESVSASGKSIWIEPVAAYQSKPGRSVLAELKDVHKQEPLIKEQVASTW